jgi:hypothetical protein
MSPVLLKAWLKMPQSAPVTRCSMLLRVDQLTSNVFGLHFGKARPSMKETAGSTSLGSRFFKNSAATAIACRRLFVAEISSRSSEMDRKKVVISLTTYQMIIRYFTTYSSLLIHDLQIFIST